MGDVCYYCDGTGERDFLSGAPCHECNGTGWKEEEEDPRESMSLQELIEYEEQMDAMYADDGTITAAESDRQTESGDGMSINAIGELFGEMLNTKLDLIRLSVATKLTVPKSDEPEWVQIDYIHKVTGLLTQLEIVLDDIQETAAI